MAEMSRQALEKRLVEAAKKINISSTNFAWLETSKQPDWTALLTTWSDLRRHYLWSHDTNDTVISCEVLDIYLRFTKAYIEILMDTELMKRSDIVEHIAVVPGHPAYKSLGELVGNWLSALYSVMNGITQAALKIQNEHNSA